jgi:phosphate transport system substrate-binding protein
MTTARTAGLRACLIALAAAALAGVASLSGCAELPQPEVVRIDGSSTVAPIMTAAAELFRETQKGMDVSVGTSGTGNGFRKFLEPDARLRTDIAMASRPIHAREVEQAEKLGIEFIELPIAYDGIVVAVHRDNSFCEHLTVDELRHIWSTDDPVDNWRQVRPGFPDLPLRRYGPGFEDGTFEFFVEAVIGDKKKFRAENYEASEYDDLLVQAVARDRGGIAFFGFGYFHEYRDRLRAVAIKPEGGEPTLPTTQTIADVSYRPLTRPLFIYVNVAAIERRAVGGFLEYFLQDPAQFVEHPYVGFVRLPESLQEVARRRYADHVAGSLFSDGHARGLPLARVYGLTGEGGGRK